jgi:phosphoglycolate phosphatase
MQPIIFLFDIDGTLLLTGGAGRRAMITAFARRHGRGDACEGFAFGGMTDRGIARQGLRALGLAASEQDIDALLSAYLEELAGELQSATCRVCPGVFETLASLAPSPRCAVGLGTGNVRRGADLKLAAAGLTAHFSFGGFGCDHEARGELLRVGARRGADQLGTPLERCRVIVIGDTPRDVEAAHAIGADCLAVATGSFDEATHAAHAPALVCPDLTSPAARDFLREASGG